MAGIKAIVSVGAVLLGAMSSAACSGADSLHQDGAADPAPRNDECIGTTSAALRTCAAGTTLRGIDVSAYEGAVLWSVVKNAGYVFAFARVSDGALLVDPTFGPNWSGMKAAGVVRGAYQYFRPNRDPLLQAQVFLGAIDAAGGLHPGDLPPVLDLETDAGLAPAAVIAAAKAWVAEVQAVTGVRPIVYTGPHMSSVIGTAFSAFHLWVANYGATCPLMPSGWTDWRFWQTSETGSVAGVPGVVDLDLFNGSLAELHALTIQPPGAGSTAPGPAVGPGLGHDEGPGTSVPPKETESVTISPCR